MKTAEMTLEMAYSPLSNLKRLLSRVHFVQNTLIDSNVNIIFNNALRSLWKKVVAALNTRRNFGKDR